MTPRRGAVQSAGAGRSRLPRVDGASAVTRPEALTGATYLEEAHLAQGREQLHLHAAQGESRSRRARALAAALDLHVQGVRTLVASDDPLVVAARDRLVAIEEALSPLVLRSTRSQVGYLARMIGLLLGDIVGTSMAVISLGEIPMLAVIQGGSAGVACVTAGLAGEQLGRAAQAGLRKQPDEVPTALEPYRHLLDGRRIATLWLAGLLLLATSIVVLIGAGIFTLRTAIEGSASGWTFAALSSGIALASFVNAWVHADAVADLLDAAERDYRRATRRHLRLTLGLRLLAGLRADEVAASIGRVHGALGSAASEHLTADMNRALMESPDVVGHGRPGAPIGRKPRPAGRGDTR
ncbi:hypothetical protein GOPIP_081_00450 [Gordonia polyisoprenivorans NBRC 16320 = JCM 10675]|nr:hypothetical protein GOPIP_081_00450 [Gordonia polyisoprenivorans NBRC 16320 = JCM 10675]